MVNDNFSPLCNRDNEIANHVFGYCDLTKEVWNLIGAHHSVDRENGYINVFQELFLKQPYQKELYAIMIVTC